MGPNACCQGLVVGSARECVGIPSVDFQYMLAVRTRASAYPRREARPWYDRARASSRRDADGTRSMPANLPATRRRRRSGSNRGRPGRQGSDHGRTHPVCRASTARVVLGGSLSMTRRRRSSETRDANPGRLPAMSSRGVSCGGRRRSGNGLSLRRAGSCSAGNPS